MTQQFVLPYGLESLLCGDSNDSGGMGMLGWEMRSWNKAAGILTIFGLTGLLLSPLILTPAVSAPAPEGRIVAIAIAAGPQLKLLPIGNAVAAPQQTHATAQAMVCGRVFRLSFADVGFSCTGQSPTDAAVAMKPHCIRECGRFAVAVVLLGRQLISIAQMSLLPPNCAL